MERKLIIIASILALTANTLRIGIINDIHLNISYQESCSFPFCFDHGKYGLDSPVLLLSTILDDLSSQEGNLNKFYFLISQSNLSANLDAILLQGDLVIHGLSSDSMSSNNWPQIMSTISQVISQIQVRFPYTPIIPAIGNNDVIYHHQAPTQSEKTKYYSEMFALQFEAVNSNSKQSTINAIRESFVNGGYYVYELTESISVIVINSVYFGYKNTQDFETANAQIQWLHNVLQHAPEHKKFIISMHIPPSIFYYKIVEDFWYETFKDQFLQIIDMFQERIIVILGAHIHSAEIRATMSVKYPNLSLPMLLTPSISPIFYNNPGYSIIEIDPITKSISHMEWRFLQLYEYTLTRSTYNSFISIDPQALFNVQLSNSLSIKAFVQRMRHDANLFGVYMASKMGYGWLMQQGAGILYPLSKMLMQKSFQQDYICAMMYYDISSYNQCEFQ